MKKTRCLIQSKSIYPKKPKCLIIWNIRVDDRKLADNNSFDKSVEGFNIMIASKWCCTVLTNTPDD
jgi:hypothetical protein